MKTNLQQLCMYVMTVGVIAVLLLSLGTEARVVKRSGGGAEECQYECSSNVYKCDLRCKYLDFLKGENLKRCHRQCADKFLDCFIGCFSSIYSFKK